MVILKELSLNVKRPVCCFCASMISGIMLCSAIGIKYFIVIVAAYLLSIVLLFDKVKQIAMLAVGVLIFFTFGGISFVYSQSTYASAYKEFCNKTVTVEGYVDSEIDDKDGKLSFFLRTDKIRYGNNTSIIRGKVLVNTTSKDGSKIKNKIIEYRSRISFQGVIEKPKPAVNPGGFDYRRYLASVGTSGTAYVKDINCIDIIGTQGGGLLHKLGFKIKNSVLNIITLCLDKNQAGLLSGMIIGYKNGLDENAFSAFSKAGLTHIMVASGMNVAFIILPLTFIFKKLHMGTLPSSILTILVLILFVFVAGFSASVVRAVIMGIMILLGKILMRETDIYTSISASAIILLILNPYTIFDIGFQLSFSATISLVIFYPKINVFVNRKYIPRFISDTLAATVSAQIGVVPVTLYYFNNFSTISILSNLLVVPLVQIITIIGFVMVFAGIVNINAAVLAGYMNNTFLSFVLFVTEFTSRIPYASVKLPTPSLLMILAYYLFILYIFKWRDILKNKRNFRFIKYACMLLIAVAILLKVFIPGPLEITFLDVGQGDSAFIRTAHGTKVLIDGGGRAAGSKTSFDIGQSVMVPYILDQGTKKLDIVIATHGHSDHTEGLEAILEEMRVGMVLLPDTDGEGFKKIIEICTNKKVKMVKCKKGDIIRLDKDTVFDVLSPLQWELDSLAQQSLNDSSLVLKLKYKNIKVLFTGDAGIPVEQRMLKEGQDLSSDILKVGHHGSYTATCEEFLNNQIYNYAVISVGKNKFGHPSQYVVDRLAEKGSRILRTDETGAVIVTSYGEKLDIRTMLSG
jgi:competence protein ComEC